MNDVHHRHLHESSTHSPATVSLSEDLSCCGARTLIKRPYPSPFCQYSPATSGRGQGMHMHFLCSCHVYLPPPYPHLQNISSDLHELRKWSWAARGEQLLHLLHTSYATDRRKVRVDRCVTPLWPRWIQTSQ